MGKQIKAKRKTMAEISREADERHCAAWQATNVVTDASGGQGRVSQEVALVALAKAWELYAVAHRMTNEHEVGQDGYASVHWEAIGEGIRGLLNMETGPRIDCGSFDSRMVAHMKAHGLEKP